MDRVIAVIGGGQLARMMVPPAVDLNITLKTLVEAEDSSAAQVTARATVGDPNDLGDVLRLVEGAEVVTFEHEHIPQEVLAELDTSISVQPPPHALLYAQDKLAMRRKLTEIGVPVPTWAQVTSHKQLRRFGQEVSWPFIAKTPVGGYDGKGVRVVNHNDSLDDWLERGPVLVEEKVPFTRELAVLLARSPSGEIARWPIAQTIQRDGVCAEVIAPAPLLSHSVQKQAYHAAETIAHELGVTGVLAVEMFLVEQSPSDLSASDQVPPAKNRKGRGSASVFVNELAMRPHNSGHWTINGSQTSQFEQHLRAVLDLPLGPTDLRGRVWVMKNLLGTTYDHAAAALPAALKQVPSAHIHLYGKSVRPGRKLGHVNVEAACAEEAARQAQRAIDILFGEQ
ncbi:MAG: 5-(carboxyamino)imidazole ribonucleotide synthase [Actinomycetaceae bacterium]|nr:5-(carboxyamino)imidazole ribonucleotide synthase [Actinomycetaceae bacterium]